MAVMPDGDAFVYVFDAAYLIVPFCASLVLRRGHRWLAVLGLAAISVEWALAYHDNQVEHGGEWNRGTDLAFVTGINALLFFLPLWLLGLLSGAAIRRLIEHKRGKGRAQPS